MSEPEETRKEPYLVEGWHAEPSRGDLAVNPEGRTQAGREAQPRAMGSPLPVGSAGRPMEHGYRPTPPPGRSLTSGTEENGMQRAMSVLKQAMPFVQKLLPLIDGNLATAVAGLLTPRPHSAPPPPAVDLTPVHSQLTELQVQQEDLRKEVLEQNSSLKRVADQLDMVREATDRNTLEQQELIEDLKAVGNKVNLFALLLFVLLIVSVVLNLVLFLHIKQVLP